jgi:hypothetical protein
MKKYLVIGIALGAVFFSASSHALEVNDLSWFTSLGYEFGGERYSGVTYVGSGITENAYANNGWLATLGASFPNNVAKTFETQVSIGYKFGGPTGQRSGVIWNSNPIELMEYYRQSDWRAGVGLAYHINTQVIAQSVNQAAQTFRLDPALGYVASLSYSPVAQNYAMEVRYTYLKQSPADLPDLKLKASVFGAALHYRF